MLREICDVRQEPGDHFRRWFTDASLEIIVWYDQPGAIFGFQICYDPKSQPRALTWTRKRGFSHTTIDDGDDKPTVNRSPMLRPCSNYDMALLRKDFLGSADGLPAAEREFIEGKLVEADGRVGVRPSK